MTRILLVIGSAALLAACDGAARMSPISPTQAIPVATVPPPTPPPAPVFLEPYTQLTVGSTFARTVDRSANPECIGVPGFGCQYFRIMPDRDGTLEVEVNWVIATQPDQGLDLSLESARGQVWADGFGNGQTSLRSFVKAGETSQITVWYTFPGVEFTLQTALQPS
jgi:hypothetical protein